MAAELGLWNQLLHIFSMKINKKIVLRKRSGRVLSRRQNTFKNILNIKISISDVARTCVLEGFQFKMLSEHVFYNIWGSETIIFIQFVNLDCLRTFVLQEFQFSMASDR